MIYWMSIFIKMVGKAKMYFRGKAIRLWIKGIKVWNNKEPIREEVNAFYVGFNMGWNSKLVHERQKLEGKKK